MLNRTPIKMSIQLALVGVISMMFAACSTNPVTGRSQFVLVSPDQELAMGRNYHPNLVNMYDGEYRDPKLQRYLEYITLRLHRCSHRSEMPMRFTMLNTSVINAFAIPGHVYCTRGLLAEFDNEAQFAAVMGHELGHVAALHSAARMTTQMLVGLGGMALGAALGDSGDADLYLTAGLIGAQFFQLSYSREQEHQADRLGAYYMALAGWDPREAVAAQILIQSLSSSQPSFFGKYLSTHPPTNERIPEIHSLISEKRLLDGEFIQGDGIFKERWDRRLAGLREVNLAFEPYDKGIEKLREGEFNAALDLAQQAIEKAPEQPPFYRLKGDALLGLERYESARAALNDALERDPEYVLANISLGRLAMAQERHAEAERQFQTALQGFPNSAQALWGMGQACFAQNKYRQAVPALEQLVQMTGNRLPQANYLLAVSYDRLSRHLQAFEQYRAALVGGLEGDAKAVAERRHRELREQLQPSEQQQS